MFSHINFSLGFGFSLLLVSIFVNIFIRTDLNIATLFIIELSKPNILSLLYFLNIFFDL